MLRLAILGMRGRLSAFTGAFVALFVAAILVMACGVLFESGIRAHPPVERYAAATAVIAGRQTTGPDHDVVLTERARWMRRWPRGSAGSPITPRRAAALPLTGGAAPRSRRTS